jgi:hypothetical protein
MNCDVCRATVTELRRGRCWGCYARWVDARAVGVGARCCICAERRRDLLRSMELLGAWMPICYTCSGRANALDPMPQNLAGIRTALRRERRERDRRGGKADTRVFQHDRRGDDRRGQRTERGDDWLDIDEAMILEITLEGLADPAPRPRAALPPPIPGAALHHAAVQAVLDAAASDDDAADADADVAGDGATMIAPYPPAPEPAPAAVAEGSGPHASTAEASASDGDEAFEDFDAGELTRIRDLSLNPLT